jgi:hypothetical protein
LRGRTGRHAASRSRAPKTYGRACHAPLLKRFGCLGTGHKSGHEHAYVVRREFCIVDFDLNQVRQKIIRWPVAPLGDHDVEVPAEFLEHFRARRVVSQRENSLWLATTASGLDAGEQRRSPFRIALTRMLTGQETSASGVSQRTPSKRLKSLS